MELTAKLRREGRFPGRRPNRNTDDLKLLAVGPLHKQGKPPFQPIRTVICECTRFDRTTGYAVGHLDSEVEDDPRRFIEEFTSSRSHFSRLRTFPSYLMAESWVYFAHLLIKQSGQVLVREIERGTRRPWNL